MFDFRLKVFYTVAKRLNFTKAAEELYITQPAVTRHIHELENQFKVTLFERSGNKKMLLTSAGITLLRYVEQLDGLYRALEFDMNSLIKQHGGALRIGASNTVGQYVIPSFLAKFHARFQGIRVTMVTGNSTQIEEALINKEIDMGVIEGINRSPQIHYQEFIKDELVLVSATGPGSLKKDSLKIGDLKNYPLLLREQGSGSFDVVVQALKQVGLHVPELQVEMRLGRTESIKAYLANSNCLAFLSIHSILTELKRGDFKIIDMKGLSMERSFYFIHLKGQAPALADLFMRFVHSIK